jgi:hypothetical protein
MIASISLWEEYKLDKPDNEALLPMCVAYYVYVCVCVCIGSSQIHAINVCMDTVSYYYVYVLCMYVLCVLMCFYIICTCFNFTSGILK